jgi:PBSX family phage portal protein
MTAKPFCYVTKEGKTVSQLILDQYAFKSKEGESNAITPDQFSGTYGQYGLLEPLYNATMLARLPEVNTFHMRCINTKARDIAGLGWDLTPTKEKPAESQKEVLEEFFSGMYPTLSMILDNVTRDLETIGYGVMEIVRESAKPDGKPVLLAHIPAHYVRVHKSGNKYMQQRLTKKVWFKKASYAMDVDFETGMETELGTLPAERRATEIIWFANYCPRADFYGAPDIIPALGALVGDIARRDYNASFFTNFGVPAYACFITGNFDPGEIGSDGKTALETTIGEHFDELNKNPHSTLILSLPTSGDGDVKIDIKPLSVDAKEASFRLYRKDNRDEIMAAHGVPSYRIGITEGGSLGGGTALESTEIYKRSVIEPRQEIIEAVINKYIVLDGFGITDYIFELADIDTTDEAHDLEMVLKLFGVGAITPNQIIEMFAEQYGLEKGDDPTMDLHYIGNSPIDGEQPDPMAGLLDPATLLPIGQESLGEVPIPAVETPPIETGVLPPAVEKALRSLQNKLLKIAVKEMN